jgi:16S rRNA (cytidine1402-2'-O)-methyltransferase
MTATLYVVATPIGNLGDMTARGIETLRTVDRIVAEDTRRTRQLLTHFGITGKPLDALHAHSTAGDVARVVESLQRGESVAVVTDAGTPIVSDPGAELVRAASAAGIRVVPIPGASAVLAALMGAGLAGDGRFRFVGFLPRDGRERRDALAEIAATPEQVVIFESPNRTTHSLVDLAAGTPERTACVARELTKIHEELTRGALKELAALEREWMGEVVIVLGAHDPKSREAVVDDAAIDARIDAELAGGRKVKEIAELLQAWSGRGKRELYERVIGRRGR